MDPELQGKLKKLVNLSILVLALISIYLLFTYVFPIVGKMFSYIPILFMPFIIAVILALLIEPVVSFFEELVHLKRGISVAISLISVTGLFVCILAIIISTIIRELNDIYHLALSYSDNIVNQVMASISSFRLFYLKLNLPPEAQNTLQETLEQSIELIKVLINASIEGLIQGLTALPGLIILLMISMVASFFIIKDRAILRRFSLYVLPINIRNKTQNVVGELFKALIGFLKAYTILISITMIITLIALKILGVKYGFTIGIIIGLMDILPVLGPGTILIPWILWELISGNVKLGISLLILYLIISIVRQFLEPKIVGDNIGLHPLATLVSLYIGLQLGGIIGMILGPVIIVITMAMYRAGLFDGINWRRL